MKLDGAEQEAVRNLGATINRAIEKSFEVARAIEDLRALGFEPHLSLKLEIGLQKFDEPEQSDEVDFSADETEESDDDAHFELTDEDVRTLRRMKIRLDN